MANDEGVVKADSERRSSERLDLRSGRLTTFRLSRGLHLRLVVLDAHLRPLTGSEYLLDLGDEAGARTGTLGPLGEIEHKVPLGRESATLRVGDSTWEFRLEQDAPPEETAGVQVRLASMGFDPGPADGVAGPNTEAALREFQRAAGIEETGQADGATRALPARS